MYISNPLKSILWFRNLASNAQKRKLGAHSHTYFEHFRFHLKAAVCKLAASREDAHPSSPFSITLEEGFFFLVLLLLTISLVAMFLRIQYNGELGFLYSHSKSTW